jgi:hypothetical protein
VRPFLLLAATRTRASLGAALGIEAALVVLPELAVHRDLASASVFVFTLLWSSEVFRFAMGHLKYR